MAAYVIMQLEVTDTEKHAKYREIATPMVEKYAGNILRAAARWIVVEGQLLPRVVIVEFPSMERFK